MAARKQTKERAANKIESPRGNLSDSLLSAGLHLLAAHSVMNSSVVKLVDEVNSYNW